MRRELVLIGEMIEAAEQARELLAVVGVDTLPIALDDVADRRQALVAT